MQQNDFEISQSFYKLAILLISSILVLNTNAQEVNKSISANLKLTHFIAEKSGSNRSFMPINPGIEILYSQLLSSNLSISSGVFYSYSKWDKSVGAKSYFRGKAHELALPLLFKRVIGEKAFMTIGSYAGWLVSGKTQYSNEEDVQNWIDIHDADYDESSKFTWDLYLDVGFRKQLSSENTLSFAPFIKYKLTDNWMGKFRTKLSCGFSIKYEFSF